MVLDRLPNEIVNARSMSEGQIKATAVKISLDNPGKYITLYAQFGLFAQIDTRLHVFAPTDSCRDWYALNGKVKPFSKAQKLTDELMTPTGCQSKLTRIRERGTDHE